MPPLPTVQFCVLDQENQGPRRLVQKLGVQCPLQDSAGPLPEATSQRNQRNWWEAFNSGILWRSSGLALGDKMRDLGPLPGQRLQGS
ncbi:hypothetical protein MC885_020449 [Smutsia gigantea]|nr:hypothetical protein MC885_020449 [Smutsia gigantea]